MKILVTGAAGFLGGAVCRALGQKTEVIATDISGEGVIACDLRDRPAVHALVERSRPQCIVHCGAISGPMIVDDAASVFDVNVGGTLNLAEAARRHGARRFVLASSIAVYGRRPDRTSTVETAELLASDPYGASKIAAEAILRSYDHAHFEAIALRISSVYGEGRRVDCIVQRAVRAWRAGHELTLASGGLVPRQLVHISDAAKAMVMATEAERPTQFAYNVSGGTYLSEAELAELIREQAPELRIVHSAAAATDWPDGDIGPLDITAAARDLGYNPACELRAGLSAYVEQLMRSGSEPSSRKPRL